MQTQPMQSGAAFAMMATRESPPGDPSKTSAPFWVKADRSPPGSESKDPIRQQEKKLLGKEPNARPDKPDSLDKTDTADPKDPQVAAAVSNVQANLAAQERVALETAVFAKSGPMPAQKADEAMAASADNVVAVPALRDPQPLPAVELPVARLATTEATDEDVAIASDLTSDEVETLGIQSVKVGWTAAPSAAHATDEAHPNQDVLPAQHAASSDETKPGLQSSDEAIPANALPSDEYAPPSDEAVPSADLAGASQPLRKGEAADDLGPAEDLAKPTAIGKDAKVQPLPAENLGDASDEAGADGFKKNKSDEAAPSKGSPASSFDGVQAKVSQAVRQPQGVQGVDVAARVDRVAVVRQVADRIELLAAAPRDGVTVRLEPRDLGSITMVVKSQGDEVDAHIVASNEGVRAALDGSRVQLREALESRGLNLGTMTVGQEAAHQSSERDAAMHHAPTHRGFSMGNAAGEQIAAPRDWRAAARSNHGMDLWI